MPSGLDYFGARYYGAAVGRFTSADAPFADQHVENPQSWNLYQYGYNNPLANVDVDGRSVWTKVIKVGIKVARTGNAAAAFADNLQDASTLLDSNASMGSRALALVSLASEISPISVGDIKDVAKIADNVIDAGKHFVKRADDVKDAAKGGGKTFDEARREAFEFAGMTDPKDVKFSRVDPATGTVVEFKGPNGAKVGYDGPHSAPGPEHHRPHVSAQTGGKTADGGRQRRNISYCGEQHPCRSRDQGGVEPH